MTILNKSLVTAAAILIMGCSGMADKSANEPGINDIVLKSYQIILYHNLNSH